jgi:hypothetical protein
MSNELKNRLFAPGSIVVREQADKGTGSGGTAAEGGNGSLSIGSLKGEQTL